MSQITVQGFRLSPQQRYFWSLQQGLPSHTCQVQAVFSIQGYLQAEVLKRALADVVKRHEILRTAFQRPPGIKIPFQVISDEAKFSWEFSDFTNLDQESVLNPLIHSFGGYLSKPFDFERGPLLRSRLCRISPDRHVLLISLPALCGDPASILNLMKDLGRAYALILRGEGFAGEPMQYADFAEWQNELLEGSDEDAAEVISHWQDLSARSALPFTLPLEKRRTDEQKFQPESVSIEFDATCVAKVETLAREYETSIQAVLFAFWQALVWRLTNQSEFVIFNLCEGRKLEDLQGALGAYAKYLPVACRCADVPFAPHLHAAQAALTKAEECEEYFDPNNFAEVARNAVAFEFADEAAVIETAGLTLSLTCQQLSLGPFKLKLSCFRSGRSIHAELVYNSHSFDRKTVERYAGYLTRLVAKTPPTENNTASIGEIEIVDEVERRRLLIDINHTQSEFSRTHCIHQLFEEQVALTPEAIALVCGERQLTYSELNASANRLAHLLRHRGLVSNACVGICTERSAETIIAMLGILKAGGAYVPLNPGHPPARLTSQLAESKTSFLITNGGGFDESLEFYGEIIDLERDRALLRAEPDINPSSIRVATSLAYIIYTSGSSGVPKGVAVGHQGLVNYTQFILRRLHVKEPLRFAMVSTLGADLGNTCIFPALVSGGCLHLISYDVAMEGALFSAYTAKHPIDVLKIVPSHFSALLASAPQGEVLPKKYLILGGEALSWELVDRISQTNPACEIINHYGPTETTVGSLTCSVKPLEDSTHSLSVPIGQPIANTSVYILDRHLNVVPIGVAGELYIGGAGLAVGYLNQPTETAARFVPNPFSNETDERLYRTGDLARYLPDGNIEFLGRIDNQVKVRGFRVELAEIETVLLMHKEVRQAVVIVESEKTPNPRLLAYVITSASKPPNVDELRTFVGQHLPDYMIPASFVFLKTMPLTANGKIDRAALPAPDEARPDLQRLFVEPRTAVETELAGIWAKFLRLNEVGVHDNFFELGGHSLLATQVVSRMRKAFNCEIPLRSLFESPTIAQLAEQIEGSMTETERLLAEIEELSDEEVEIMLKTEQL